MVLRDIASGDMRQFRKIVQKADRLECDGIVLPLGTMGPQEVIADDPPGPLAHYDRVGGGWVKKSVIPTPLENEEAAKQATLGRFLQYIHAVVKGKKPTPATVADLFAEITPGR